ncbi:MAG TPA: GntR family transcriptional regulator [Polyangia bacterium]|jgi:DNA-binding FadR family transcriptional regulator
MATAARRLHRSAAPARNAAAASPAASPTSAAAVFERLLGDIVGGAYGPGARLPAERELARALGASRPTLREALRRLGEWGLIEAHPGSGVEVRPQRDWSLDVLPAYLRFGAAKRGPAEMGALVRDLLAVRRSLFVDVLKIVGDRIRPGSLTAARAHAQAAFAARSRPEAFVREDFEAMRAVVEAADFLPALWLLGGLSEVYAQIAATLTGTVLAPPDYLASFRAVFDALEAGRTEAACTALSSYLGRHDRRLLATLGVRP